VDRLLEESSLLADGVMLIVEDSQSVPNDREEARGKGPKGGFTSPQEVLPGPKKELICGMVTRNLEKPITGRVQKAYDPMIPERTRTGAVITSLSPAQPVDR